ncbi:MAG: 50S ribosomal protein L6 [Thermoplasmata archaeon]
MPIAGKLEETIVVPQGVNVSREGNVVFIKGPNGELERKFEDSRITIDIQNEGIYLYTDLPSKREKALLGTYASHLRNMVKGVQEDFTYKLKIVYSHFPMKVRTEGKYVVVENFIGEEKPRKAKVAGDTKVKIQGDLVTLNGPNKEHVGQTAANIEHATKIKRRDPRVFQDGVYIIEKAGNPVR